MNYDKLTLPIQDMLESINILLMGGFGGMMGDQREGLLSIYHHAGGLYTLFMDVITHIGVDNLCQRPYLRAKFQGLINPIIERSNALLEGVDGPLNEEQIIAVEYLHNTGQLLSRYINQLWLASLIMNNQLRARLQITSLANLIPTKPPADLYEEVAYIKKLEAHGYIKADPEQIMACIYELLFNAARYTHVGQITLRSQHSATSIHISVEDTGVGIASRWHDSIFEPFWQVDDGREGLGLGLYIARAIARAHGGALEVDSLWGQGSQFHLTLPAISP